MSDNHHPTRRETPDAHPASLRPVPPASDAPELPEAIVPESLPRETAPALVSRMLEMRAAFQRRLKR